jgi:outer membrane protein assembly factor BamB
VQAALYRVFGFALICSGWLLVDAASRAENWPGWRGPTGVGMADGKDLPLTWDGKTKENLLWKMSLGGVGNSSPIVWGERVLVTASKKQTNQEEMEKIVPEHYVICFQAQDGKEVWRTSVPPGPLPMGYAIYAVPTPGTDGKLIYCWFSSGVIAALDFDGKILWRSCCSSTRPAAAPSSRRLTRRPAK